MKLWAIKIKKLNLIFNDKVPNFDMILAEETENRSRTIRDFAMFS